MTVYESVFHWLNTILADEKNDFPSVYTVIDLEMIPNWQEFYNAGLFSSPNDIHTPLMGGQVRHTEFKSFYLRRSFSEFQDRLYNETFFEKLREVIYNKNLDSEMPVDDREWGSIEINAGIYPAQRNDANRFADYLVSLKLVYVL